MQKCIEQIGKSGPSQNDHDYIWISPFVHEETDFFFGELYSFSRWQWF